MATEQVSVLPFSVASLVEDVLRQHGTRRGDFTDMASRKVEEASLRRYEAAEWLRKTVGVVGGKDLPAQPSEEELRLGLRSGIILCNVLNKVHPGAVPKVVEGSYDAVVLPDGAALSAYQYFENTRNFLVAAEELGIPCFEASDLEQGGKSARIVNCVLALKSYGEWKQSGGNGTWKYNASLKPPASGPGAKPFARKSSEPFMNSFSRTSSLGSCSGDQGDEIGHDLNEEGASHSLSSLVRAVISSKKQDEIPNIVESMLNKVMEEFERRLAGQSEPVTATTRDQAMPDDGDLSPTGTSCDDLKMEEACDQKIEEEVPEQIETQKSSDETWDSSGGSTSQLVKQEMLVDQQQRHIQELRQSLHSTKAGMQFLQMKYQEEFYSLGKHLRGLAHAASGYQRVLEENRKLYNQVQDLKGNIRVYCRVRPFLNGQGSRFNAVDSIEEGNITILTPSKYGKEGRKSFSFNKVFGPLATQAEVFSDTQPLIRSVLDGFNVCIFAYGQTGSGKTHTMTGPKELTEEGLGVNYRALSDLFFLSDQRKDVISYDIAVQMLEIYNEQVRDLLSTDGSTRRLEIRNSSQNGINVPEACLIPVSSTSDVISIMNTGHKNRTVGATAMNDRSSRSHSCLTVHVQGRNLTSGTVIRGSMHLVDLAGSERVDKSEVTGDRLKEAQFINKSLSALGDVIASLASKNAHVPYRNSKLTQLLQDSLGGQAKTLMFVHISPEPDAVGETLSTLKFAERVATVELGAARVNKEGVEVKELKEQIANLKAALARKDGETDQSRHSRSSTPEKSSSKSNVTSSCTTQQSWNGVGDVSDGRRKFADDAGYGQTKVKKSSSIPRRRSLDPRDLIASSSPWTPLSSTEQTGKEDEKEFSQGDWVDKIMVNRHDIVSQDDSLLGQWEADSRQLPDIFFQNYTRDPSKIYPEQPFNKSQTNKKDSQEYDAQRNNRYEVASTDESEDLDVGTSDSSEPDLQWQSSIPRLGSLLNAAVSKPKKTSHPRGSKSTETRSFIPSLIPSPSRKLQNGVSPGKPGKQATLHGDGKRRGPQAK